MSSTSEPAYLGIPKAVVHGAKTLLTFRSPVGVYPSMITLPPDRDGKAGRVATEYLIKRMTPPTKSAVTATIPMRVRMLN